jgi:hypothetical protein
VVAGPNNDGYITAVETGYAAQRSFPVAAVQNNSGNFVLPTEPNVFAALSYATQQTDGTHTLNFSPPDPNAYNPSTYSYLLAPITTQYLPVDKGAALTQFLDYALTFGQAEANRLKYASIGHALITYGLDASKKIPGYVGPTPEELAAIPPDPNTGQANPTNAAAIGTVASTPAGPGGTTSSGGSSGGGAATAPGGQGSAGSGAATAGAPGSKTSSSASRSLPGRTSRALAGGARTSGAGSLGPDASVSLDPAVGAFAQTGGEQGLLAAVAALVVVAATGARRFARRRQTT